MDKKIETTRCLGFRVEGRAGLRVLELKNGKSNGKNGRFNWYCLGFGFECLGFDADNWGGVRIEHVAGLGLRVGV